MDLISSSSICCVIWEEFLNLTRVCSLIRKNGTIIAPVQRAGMRLNESEQPLLILDQWHFLHHSHTSCLHSHASSSAISGESALLYCPLCLPSTGRREDQGKWVERAASGYHRGGGLRVQLQTRNHTDRSQGPLAWSPRPLFPLQHQSSAQQPLCAGDGT